MTKKFIKAIFDDGYISVMTRCIAELLLQEEEHKAFKQQRLN